jgi:O-antigen/teichoic acid export membrane protein
LRSLFLRGVKIMSTLTAPAIAILIAIAGPFIVAWCGPSLGPAIAVAHVLLLAQIFLPLYELGDPLMIARGRYSAYVTAGLVCAVLNVALSIVFVRFFGMTGVALGTLAALYVEFPWLVRVFSRAMALPVGEWMKRTAWPLYPLLALPALLAYAGGQSVLGHSILGLAVVGAVSIFAYWLAAAFTAYSPVERADLVSIVLPSRRVRAA